MEKLLVDLSAGQDLPRVTQRGLHNANCTDLLLIAEMLTRNTDIGHLFLVLETRNVVNPDPEKAETYSLTFGELGLGRSSKDGLNAPYRHAAEIPIMQAGSLDPSALSSWESWGAWGDWRWDPRLSASRLLGSCEFPGYRVLQSIGIQFSGSVS